MLYSDIDQKINAFLSLIKQHKNEQNTNKTIQKAHFLHFIDYLKFSLFLLAPDKTKKENICILNTLRAKQTHN